MPSWFRHRTKSTVGKVSYRLIHPARDEAKQVHAWLHLSSGTWTAGRCGSLAIETWSDEHGIVHRLRLPERQAEGIIAQPRGGIGRPVGLHAAQARRAAAVAVGGIAGHAKAAGSAQAKAAAANGGCCPERTRRCRSRRPG